MKISIYGVENELQLNNGEIGLLNIQNPILFRTLQKKLNKDINNVYINEIVFTNNNERLTNEIVYIQDIESYSFNNKQFVDALCKRVINEINSDISMKQKEENAYKSLIRPIVRELDLLEVEYSYKEDIDQTFYTKIPNFSFKENDDLDLLDKIINIITINNKLLRKDFFVFNRVLKMLTNDELISLNDFVKCSDLTVLLIDCLSIEDIKIKQNINIFDDYSSFSINNEFLI